MNNVIVTRRGFLGSILALAAAPAIVRVSSLMLVKNHPHPEPLNSMYYGGITWVDEGFYDVITIQNRLSDALKDIGLIIPLTTYTYIARRRV